MAMQKSLFHKDSRHLTTANAYVSGRRGRRPLQGWRVRFRCRVAISNTPINQNLKGEGGGVGGVILGFPEIVKKITNFLQNFGFTIYKRKKM